MDTRARVAPGSASLTLATMDDPVVIVGGGVGGLATAWHLLQAGRPVRICEAGNAWGGVTRTSQRDGFLLEEGPDSLISTKPAGVGLCKQLGLGDELIGTSPSARRSLIARGRRLVPVPEGVYLMAPGRMLPFAKSPLLSWPGKLRLGLDLLLPRRKAGLPEESLAAFVSRRLGREALDRLAQPMVGGIYTADPRRLSLEATMPQFPAMEQEYRSLVLGMRARSVAMRKGPGGAGPGAGTSGARYGLFATLKDGLGGLPQRLLEDIPTEARLTNCPISAVEARGKGWMVQGADGRSFAASAVVLATPAHVAARLLASVRPRLSAALRTIPYADIATCNLAFPADAFDEIPSAAGFVVPSIDHRCVVACTFVHHKYAGRAPEGQILFRAFVGGALHGSDLAGDDEALVARILQELDWRFGLRRNPLFSHMARWPRAMAQYTLGHQQRVAAIEAALAATPGLHLVGNGYRGVGIPDVCAQAAAVSAEIVS